MVRVTRELVEGGILTRAEVEAMADEATRQVNEAERFARESPFPRPEAAVEHVFVAGGR